MYFYMCRPGATPESGVKISGVKLALCRKMLILVTAASFLHQHSLTSSPLGPSSTAVVFSFHINKTVLCFRSSSVMTFKHGNKYIYHLFSFTYVLSYELLILLPLLPNLSPY